MKRLLKSIMPVLVAIGLIGMTACACPKAIGSNADHTQIENDSTEAVCSKIFQEMEEGADQVEREAELENVVLQIENKVDHCRLLAEPYGDMGVMLFTAKVSVDGELRGIHGMLAKFVKENGIWTAVSVTTYYSIERESKKSSGTGIDL